MRFDPIVHYRRLPGLGVHDNLQDFEQIVRHIGSLGIRHITFSFCKPYKQSVRNMLSAGVELVALSDAQQRQADSMSCWIVHSPTACADDVEVRGESLIRVKLRCP